MRKSHFVLGVGALGTLALAYELQLPLLSLITAALAFFLHAAAVDPGVLPRLNRPEPTTKQTRPGYSAVASADLDPPEEDVDSTLPDTVAVGSTVLRRCKDTGIYLPPNSQFCKVCGHVVHGFDHHSALLGCCVGARNRRSLVLGLALLPFGLLQLYPFAAVGCVQIRTRSDPNPPGAHLRST